MKIVSIVGARPQFIKISLLSPELRKNHEEIIIHTGQHYDYEMSKLFFDELSIPKPDYNLEVGSGSHGVQTGEMLKKLDEVLIDIKPDLMLVYGDTNSTLAGAISASKLHISLAHIEAGMRNYDRKKPEEINRILCDHISDVFFCPTRTSVLNLEKEGITEGVHLVGDVTYDVLMKMEMVADEKSEILARIGLESKEYILATIHKQKNTDNGARLAEIVDALSRIEETVIFPAHPRTLKALELHGLKHLLENSRVNIIKPLGFLDFIKLIKHSRRVITDSGGIQKEAYVFKVPCITLRETEWIETVEAGWNTVIPVERDSIIETVRVFEPQGDPIPFLGDGRAYQKIADIVDARDF